MPCLSKHSLLLYYYMVAVANNIEAEVLEKPWKDIDVTGHSAYIQHHWRPPVYRVQSSCWKAKGIPIFVQVGPPWMANCNTYQWSIWVPPWILWEGRPGLLKTPLQATPFARPADYHWNTIICPYMTIPPCLQDHNPTLTLPQYNNLWKWWLGKRKHQLSLS